jgi:hypothetical protein
MQTWWIRHGVPDHIDEGDRRFDIALNDVDARTAQARLSVFEDRKFVAGFDLRVGDECEIAGKKWRVTVVTPGERPSIELEELA